MWKHFLEIAILITVIDLSLNLPIYHGKKLGPLSQEDHINRAYYIAQINSAQMKFFTQYSSLEGPFTFHLTFPISISNPQIYSLDINAFQLIQSNSNVGESEINQAKNYISRSLNVNASDPNLFHFYFDLTKEELENQSILVHNSSYNNSILWTEFIFFINKSDADTSRFLLQILCPVKIIISQNNKKIKDIQTTLWINSEKVIDIDVSISTSLEECIDNPNDLSKCIGRSSTCNSSFDYNEIAKFRFSLLNSDSRSKYFLEPFSVSMRNTIKTDSIEFKSLISYNNSEKGSLIFNVPMGVYGNQIIFSSLVYLNLNDSRMLDSNQIYKYAINFYTASVLKNSKNYEVSKMDSYSSILYLLMGIAFFIFI